LGDTDAALGVILALVSIWAVLLVLDSDAKTRVCAKIALADCICLTLVVFEAYAKALCADPTIRAIAIFLALGKTEFVFKTANN
jgi:hypothetical protein